MTSWFAPFLSYSEKLFKKETDIEKNLYAFPVVKCFGRYASNGLVIILMLVSCNLVHFAQIC